MNSSANEKWRKIRGTLGYSLGLGTLGLSGLSYWLWGPWGALASVAALWCIALGFWVTELLIGVMTQVKRANPTAIALLAIGKFTWWGVIFLGAKLIPHRFDSAVALGMGTFLCALLVSSLVHYGMPRITDGNSQ